MDNIMTEQVYLKDLPKRSDLIGKPFNIIKRGVSGFKEDSLKRVIRIFKGAESKLRKGFTWIYWYWEREDFRECSGDSGVSAIGLWEGSNENNCYLEFIK